MFLTLNFCSEQESSPAKINNCLELADAIEEVFDTIQIEAYESETVSYTHLTLPTSSQV